ncbi:MAG: efflux RND transporter permease subunit [Hyphomonadaceae bacterium]|nr:efflux RND transporter permease subunit [Hyphomonadaceae bacterium]
MLSGIVAWWGRNPVAGNLLMLACAVAGFLSFTRMEKEFFPPGKDNAVYIEAFWPGASPEDMESQVTVRLEEAVADLDGINWVRSRSGEGTAWINLAANPGVDIEALTQQARSKIDSISGLPSNMEPVRVERRSFRNWSIIIALHGQTDERTLREAAERLRDRLGLIDGATNTIVVGAREPEVSIEVSEEALRRYGLTFDDVASAIRRTSVNLSSGAVRTDDGDYQLRARNLADNRVDFETIVVRQTPDGGVVKVGDVARVIDGFQDVNAYSRMNGEPSLLVSVQTGDRFNITKVAKAVEETVEKARETLPAGVQISTIYNENEDYTSLTGILFQNALTGFALIFLLLLLTLHPKVAVWATIGVMTAFMGSFIILPYVDVSLNFMTVFGFLLVLGIMVDDAIIVGEAVYERIERGEHGVEASILATQIVLKPLVASVVVTMLAFSPWMLLQSEVQQFTRSISIVVMSTLFFSLVETLIILPAHLAHVTPPKGGATVLGRLMAVQQKCAHSVIWVARNVHRPVLRLAVQWRYLTLAIFIGAFVMAIGVVSTGRIKQTFMPEVEGDFMQVSIELPQTTPFARMEEVAAQLDAARQQLEAETGAVAYIDPNTEQKSRGVVRSWSQAIEENAIRAYVGLTPPETRPKLRSSDVTKKLEALMGPVPDAERISFSLSGNDQGAEFQIAILGENPDDLRAAVDELKAKLLTYSAISSVRDSQEAAIEELRLKLLPGAEQTGISIADVSRQVRQAYFGEEAQRLPRDGDDVRVYVRYPRDDRRTLESLQQFRVRTADGREVPLASVAEIEFAPGVTGIDRRQRMRSILVEAEGQKEERAKIMRELNEQFFPTLEAKYPTISRRAIGEAEAQEEFFAELGPLLVMSLFAMYMLLAIVFRSYWQPALIMSAIPFAFMGSTFGHLLFGTAFALFSYLGMIAAAGVVVNDNVVLIDKVNQLRGFFGLRRLGPGEHAHDGEGYSTVTGGDGAIWEIKRYSEELDLDQDLLAKAAALNFRGGPIEIIRSNDAFHNEANLKERAHEAEAEGYVLARVTVAEGAIEGAVSRFRQIFLTSVTEFVGTSPMLLEGAAIAQFLKPMVLSLAFGVLLCMPVTLIMTPVWYVIGKDMKSVLGRVRRIWDRGWTGRAPEATPAE